MQIFRDRKAVGSVGLGGVRDEPSYVWARPLSRMLSVVHFIYCGLGFPFSV
jgi:hypothetical protein